MPKMMIYLRKDLYQKVKNSDRKQSHIIYEALKIYFRNLEMRRKKEEETNGWVKKENI